VLMIFGSKTAGLLQPSASYLSRKISENFL
jgi:hypothetical protein